MFKSWTLKVDRAEQHLQDLRDAIDRYSQGHPYEAVRVIGRPKCDEHSGFDCWRYRLHVTAQPDPGIAVICGDVLFNLRSALDHIAVAMVPSARRGNASFPVVAEGIWAKENRRYILRNPEPRRRFRTAVGGMPKQAVALIKSIQPYQLGNHPQGSGLYQLNRLNNADKHRQLVTFASGLRDAVVTITHGASQRIQRLPPHSLGVAFRADGAIIAHGGRPGHPATPESEMDVKLDGSLCVAVKVIEVDGDKGDVGYMDVLELFDTMIPWLHTQVFPTFEPFVRWR